MLQVLWLSSNQQTGFRKPKQSLFSVPSRWLDSNLRKLLWKYLEKNMVAQLWSRPRLPRGTGMRIPQPRALRRLTRRTSSPRRCLTVAPLARLRARLRALQTAGATAIATASVPTPVLRRSWRYLRPAPSQCRRRSPGRNAVRRVSDQCL